MIRFSKYLETYTKGCVKLHFRTPAVFIHLQLRHAPRMRDSRPHIKGGDLCVNF